MRRHMGLCIIIHVTASECVVMWDYASQVRRLSEECKAYLYARTPGTGLKAGLKGDQGAPCNHRDSQWRRRSKES